MLLISEVLHRLARKRRGGGTDGSSDSGCTQTTEAVGVLLGVAVKRVQSQCSWWFGPDGTPSQPIDPNEEEWATTMQNLLLVRNRQIPPSSHSCWRFLWADLALSGAY